MAWKYEYISLKYHWNLNNFEILQGVLHVNNILKLFLISFHAFMTSSILPWLKSRSTRGACHHSTFLALVTQWMSSLSRKWECGVGPRLGGIRRNRREEDFKIPVVEILSLDRVALRIQSTNIRKSRTEFLCENSQQS